VTAAGVMLFFSVAIFEASDNGFPSLAKVAEIAFVKGVILAVAEPEIASGKTETKLCTPSPDSLFATRTYGAAQLAPRLILNSPLSLVVAFCVLPSEQVMVTFAFAKGAPDAATPEMVDVVPEELVEVEDEPPPPPQPLSSIAAHINNGVDLSMIFLLFIFHSLLIAYKNNNLFFYISLV
jgi:hypothetical protein